MSAKNYPITPAKIGDRDGFRLSPDFSQDYPDLANSSGYVQVLSDNTLLVRLDTNRTYAKQRISVIASDSEAISNVEFWHCKRPDAAVSLFALWLRRSCHLTTSPVWQRQ
ncbi:MAG: hypothetical protein F6K35_49060 [Okeania sp. SIO2H7]|nr:hypothetical protein [Okeania sp. SIO2H7]